MKILQGWIQFRTKKFQKKEKQVFNFFFNLITFRNLKKKMKQIKKTYSNN